MSDQDTRNHVFISYAHIDDQVVPGAEFGWVSYLHQILKPKLDSVLGASCRIWFDQSHLRGNHLLTPEIEREVGQAHTFVAILSPGYIESTWCRRELDLFMRLNEGINSGRLFVVDLLRATPDQRKSLGLGDLKAYPFWFVDPKSSRLRIYGDPKPNPNEPDYYRSIFDLAKDISGCLHGHAPPVTGGTRTDGGDTSIVGDAHVLLAEVTDDLEPSRQQVRRYLEQARIPVRELTSHSLTAKGFDEQIKEALGNAALFVQLLSRVPFRSVPDAPDGIGVLQHQRASELGVPVLQWREPGNYVDGIESAAHKRLITLDSVRAESLESFKKAAVEARRAKNSAKKKQDAVPGSSFVFINAEQRDIEFAKRVQQHVADVASSALPLTSGTAEEIRADVEENLIECDGLLIVYGDGSAAWVRQQLKLYNKFRNKRQKEIKLLAVIEAPPDKPELGMHLQGMQMLNFKSGINDQMLRGLLKDIDGDRQQ